MLQGCEMNVAEIRHQSGGPGLHATLALAETPAGRRTLTRGLIKLTLQMCMMRASLPVLLPPTRHGEANGNTV